MIWCDDLAMANHHEDERSSETYTSSPAGWFIVCPVRHVTRTYDLTGSEWLAIGRAVKAIDSALTELYGSQRTLVASLGWFNNDHIHFHCVPTFGESVSLGSKNFDGAYTPLKISSDEAAKQVKVFLREKLMQNNRLQLF